MNHDSEPAMSWHVFKIKIDWRWAVQENEFILSRKQTEPGANVGASIFGSLSPVVHTMVLKGRPGCPVWNCVNMARAILWNALVGKASERNVKTVKRTRPAFLDCYAVTGRGLADRKLCLSVQAKGAQEPYIT